MKLIEQLKKSELWAVLVPLIVSAGLFGLTDSDTPDLVKAIPAFFSSIAMIVLAIQKQDGDNKAKVETARSIGREPVTTARDVSLSQPRSVLVDVDVAGQLTEMSNEIYGIQQRLNDLGRLDERVTKSNNDLYNIRSRILELEQARNTRASVAELEQANAIRYSTDRQAAG